MPVIPPVVTWAPGNTIPSNWANSVGHAINALDARTGPLDPLAAALFLASNGPASAAWRLLNTNDFGPGIIPSSAMADQKINSFGQSRPDFGTVLAQGRMGIFEVTPAPDGPIPSQTYYCLHMLLGSTPATTYAAQLAINVNNVNDVHVRVITNGTFSNWRRLWHDGNDGAGSTLDADLLDAQQGTYYLARANHTGTQFAASISDLALAVSTMNAAFATSATNATNATNATFAGTLNSGTPISPSQYGGGSLAVGTPSFRGLVVGTDGIVVGSGGVGPLSVAGQVSPGSYGGGNTTNTSGVPSFYGAVLGIGGISNGGPYAGGSKVSGGDISLIGALIGPHGIASDGPITVAGQQVYYPGNPPPTGGGGTPIPSGMMAFFSTVGLMPTGWTRVTAANGRYLAVAGASGLPGGPTFPEDAVLGSASTFIHAHSTPSVSVSGSASGGTGDLTSQPIGAGSTRQDGANAVASTTHTHNLSTVSLAVSGSTAAGTSGNATWLPPAYSLVLAKKD